MTASLLLKLFIGITVVLIICIPEWFKTKEGISVDLSCIDPCVMDKSYVSRVTVTPLVSLLQGNDNEEFIETAQNAILSSITFGFNMNNSAIFICDPQKSTHPMSQEISVQGQPLNVSVNIRGQYFHYSEVEPHFVVMDSQDYEYLSVPFSLEIHISNLTRHNETMDLLRHEDLKFVHDFINVSLHFESQVPFYTRPLGIIWLTLISLVFVCGLIFMVYKVKQGKKLLQ
ncbi:transmembrane protein 156 isoform X1 [Phyllobates terribilis]|uniref:transmembrane protein 156 isoform X1 n=1 Tax=Phyllobates terribilis TaxID=111132 RepID=UPI003CCA9260